MPIKIRMSQFESPISYVVSLQSGKLGIVTAEHEIYTYDTLSEEKEKLLRFNVPENSEFLYAFEPNKMRIILGSKASRILHQIDLHQKKLINRYELHQQSPTALAYSPDGSHFVCGTDHGRVLLWRSDTTTMISRLHSFPEYNSLYTKPKINYVSAIAFHDTMLATSGYGGNVVLTNYRSHTHTQRFHPGTMKNQTILFYKDTLIVGNENGVLLKISRNKKVAAQRLPTLFSEIKNIIRIGSTAYALISSKQNFISLVNIETMKIVKDRYIELNHPVTWMCQDNSNNLFVTTLSGELCQFDLQPFAQLEQLIADKSYAQAYRYCDEEPLLQESDSYLLLESIFDTTLENAKEFLEKGEIDKASKILEPFRQVKQEEISPFFSAFASYNRLKYLYEHTKLSPFYGLAEQYPVLTSTQLFKEVESLWSKRFVKAQKLFFSGKMREAQHELEPYMSVQSKRPLIQLLMQHSDILKMYSKVMQENNYAELNQLIQRYPVLRKLPSYSYLLGKAEKLLNKVNKALEIKDFNSAELLLNQIGKFSHFEEEYLRLKAFFFAASNLHHAIENQHWRSAYHLIDTHPELITLPWAEELEKQWHDKLLICERYAAKGDIGSIKKLLGGLINLQNRHDHIGDILRMGYQIQLKVLLAKNYPKFAEGIKNYCEIFGLDTEIRHLLEKGRKQEEETKIEEERLYPKKRDEWLSSINQLPDRIV